MAAEKVAAEKEAAEKEAVEKEEPEIVNVGIIKNNSIDVYKSVITHLVSFEIVVIRVVPYIVASIDIQILTDSGHIYRTVNLTGDDYRKWSTDDGYLYDFVKENIDIVF